MQVIEEGHKEQRKTEEIKREENNFFDCVSTQLDKITVQL